MKFHGITMKGEYKAQTVVDASALIWSINEESRLVYDQVTEDIWLADGSEWKNAGQNGDLPIGTEMWIYANAPPDGWALVGTPSDELLAVIGGSTYTTAHDEAGDFTLPLHSHNMNSHRHTVSGRTNTMTGANKEEGENDNTDMVDRYHYHNFSLLSTVATPGTTNNGGNEDYRPEAAVGLICSKL